MYAPNTTATLHLHSPLSWQRRSLHLIQSASQSSQRPGIHHKRIHNASTKHYLVDSHSLPAHARKRLLYNGCLRKQEEPAAMMESKRRKQMANSLLHLKSLLPIHILKPQMDKCRILGEAEKYIAVLKAEIEVLKGKKENLMQLPPPHAHFQADTEQEKERELKDKDKEKLDELWIEINPSFRCREMEVEILVTFCSWQKRRNLGLSRILSVLEKANIQVMNANGSSKDNSSFCLMLHGKIQGGSMLSTTILKDQLSYAFFGEA